MVHMYEALAKPLYDMIFVATKDVWRISTNGSCIYFDPDWIQKLGSVELDFILSHELMHIALGHIERPVYYLGDRYHLAADIVVNGKLNTYGWNFKKLKSIGKIRYETFFPTVNGASITSVEAIRNVPIDPSVMKPTERRQFMIDSEEWWNRKDDRGETGTIVLSPQDEDPDDLEYDGPTFGGDFKFSKEFFPKEPGEGLGQNKSDNESKAPTPSSKSSMMRTISQLRMQIPNPQIGVGEGNQERVWKEKSASTLDWRSMLDKFVQEEVNDYSFTPPDKRMQDSDFFLPDYNVYTESVKDVLFMVDASGSITDEILGMAFYEIKQAVEQFNGALSGTVAFFDTRVYRPTPFGGVSEINKLRPRGGGGTEFACIFRYVNSRRVGNIPSSIVVITDGESAYPDEIMANNIPVLWLVVGNRKAPWGRSVRIDK